MPDLLRTSIDKDLVILEDIIDDTSLPQRDWESIISIYNQNNRPFPISPLKCAKLVQQIGDGLKPSTVFASQGLRYKNFLTRYNKDVATLDELQSKGQVTEAEYQMVLSIRNDPFFILGRDLERVRSHKFLDTQIELRDLMMGKPEAALTYVKEFHPEEFEDKSDKQNIELTVIQFGPGILESV